MKNQQHYFFLVSYTPEFIGMESWYLDIEDLVDTESSWSFSMYKKLVKHEETAHVFFEGDDGYLESIYRV